MYAIEIRRCTATIIIYFVMVVFLLLALNLWRTATMIIYFVTDVIENDNVNFNKTFLYCKKQRPPLIPLFLMKEEQIKEDNEVTFSADVVIHRMKSK